MLAFFIDETNRMQCLAVTQPTAEQVDAYIVEAEARSVDMVRAALASRPDLAPRPGEDPEDHVQWLCAANPYM